MGGTWFAHAAWRVQLNDFTEWVNDQFVYTLYHDFGNYWQHQKKPSIFTRDPTHLTLGLYA